MIESALGCQQSGAELSAVSADGVAAAVVTNVGAGVGAGVYTSVGTGVDVLLLLGGGCVGAAAAPPDTSEQPAATHSASHFAWYVSVADDIASQFDKHQLREALEPAFGFQQPEVPEGGTGADTAAAAAHRMH